MHTDANIAQFWARRAPSVDALHKCVHTSHLAQVSSVCLHFHPWSSACALVLECSLLPRVSLPCSPVLLPPLPELHHGVWRELHGRSPLQLQLREHGQLGLCHTRHKFRIRESEKLKTILELYNMDIHQKNEDLIITDSRQWLKWSIYKLRIKNFCSQKRELWNKRRSQETGDKKSSQRTPGDCWQWKANGHCSEGESWSLCHDSGKRANTTQPNPSPSSSTRENDRNASTYQRKECQW